MKMLVADYVAEYLYAQGVQCVFEVLGGMTAHLVDAMYRHGKIRILSTHHEQAAAFAADAYARATGVPGVAMGIIGPGATNLLTGVGSCYFDSVPAVFIVGQVNRHEMKGDRPIRQSSFQEMDIVTMAGPITKAAWQVKSPDQVPTIFAEAFALALSGRPGPVLIDLPMDIQHMQIETSMPDPGPRERLTAPADGTILNILSSLRQANRPLILAGGGIRAAGAQDLFRDFVEKVRIPVVNSLMAVDAIPYADPLHVGMIGTYGNRWANVAIGNSDVLLVLGSRLDIRQTGADTEFFSKDRTIYHVDCELGEINNRVKDCQPVVTDIGTFLASAMRLMDEFPTPAGWIDQINEWRQAWPDTAEIKDIPGINPNMFFHQLSGKSSMARAYAVDVGQHQMWAAQSIELDVHQAFLTSGGMGAMGSALPMAIGASMAYPEQPIIVVAGDGGFQLNIQELQTIVRNRLPIKIVIVNNGCYGMVRQFQQTYFGERYQSSIWGYSVPDFSAVARAYGIDAITAREPADVPAALEKMWADAKSPFLLEVILDTFANAYPKIAFGRPITEMEPLAKPVDM